MDFMGEVKELQKKIENAPKFEPQGNKTMADEEVVEKHEIVASTQSQTPKMTGTSQCSNGCSQEPKGLYWSQGFATNQRFGGE